MSYYQKLAQKRNCMKRNLMGIRGMLNYLCFTHSFPGSSTEHQKLLKIKLSISELLDEYDSAGRSLGLKIKEIKIDDTI